MSQRRLFPPAGASTWGKAAEKEYQKTVEGALTTLGYEWNHVYPLRTEHGWRTGTTTKGWPDLTAIRGRFILAIEMKGYDRNGRATEFTEGQKDWLGRFSHLAGGRAWVFRPTDDWAETQEMLRHPENAPRVYGWAPDD